jgi:YHS domain-containing protein
MTYDEEGEFEEHDEGVYSAEGREQLVDDGEMEAWEEGFMEGAEMDGQKAKCATCGAMIIESNTIEKEVEGDMIRFCSEECLEKYEEKHKPE